MRIRYVEFQNPFYQLGKIYTFKLECELFEFSSELIKTGIDALDEVYEEQNIDMLVHQIELETGDLFLLEDGSSLINEDYAAQKSTANTDNTNFITQESAGDILDFTEINPFGEIGS